MDFSLRESFARIKQIVKHHLSFAIFFCLSHLLALHGRWPILNFVQFQNDKCHNLAGRKLNARPRIEINFHKLINNINILSVNWKFPLSNCIKSNTHRFPRQLIKMYNENSIGCCSNVASGGRKKCSFFFLRSSWQQMSFEQIANRLIIKLLWSDVHD